MHRESRSPRHDLSAPRHGIQTRKVGLSRARAGGSNGPKLAQSCSGDEELERDACVASLVGTIAACTERVDRRDTTSQHHGMGFRHGKLGCRAREQAVRPVWKSHLGQRWLTLESVIGAHFQTPLPASSKRKLSAAVATTSTNGDQTSHVIADQAKSTRPPVEQRKVQPRARAEETTAAIVSRDHAW